VDSGEKDAFFTGIIISGVVGFVFAVIFLTPDSAIKDGDSFVIEHASYKCTKTNELKVGK
jgi:hypothetical protein